MADSVVLDFTKTRPVAPSKVVLDFSKTKPIKAAAPTKAPDVPLTVSGVINRFMNAPMFPVMARLATGQSEAEQQALYKSMGPESAKRGEAEKFLRYIQSVGHGTARVVLGAMGMSPADITAIGAGAMTGQPEIPGAYFAAKGAVQAPGAVKRAVQNPSPENVEAALGTGAMIAGGLAAGAGSTKGAPSIEETAKVTAEHAKALTPPTSITGRAVRSLVGTSPTVAKELVGKTVEKNAAAVSDAAQKNIDNAQKHLDATRTALEDIKGEKIERGRQQSHLEREAADKHKKAVEDVRDHNDRVVAKHEKTVREIDSENKEVEETLRNRQNIEKQLEAKRAEYHRKRAAVTEKAKADERAAWGDVRTKIESGEGPKGSSGRELLNAVKTAEKTKLKGTTPEAIRTFRSIVHQIMDKLEEQEGEAAKAEGKTSVTVPKTHPLYDAYKKSVESLPTTSEGGGILPAGVNPEDLLAGEAESDIEIPFDQLHGWVSELGHEIAMQDRLVKTTGAPADIKAALTSVWKAARQSMDDIAAENGATDVLDEARAATIAEREAFSGERKDVGSAANKLDVGVDPEGVKSQKFESRAKKLGVFDPEIPGIAEDIRSLQAALTHIPAADVLQKRIKPLPEPPTVGDLRESHRLQQEPQPPEPVVMAPPTYVPPPNRPPEVEAEKITISPKDMEAANAKALQARANWWRNKGAAIVTTMAGYRLLSNVFRKNIAGIPLQLGEAATGLAATQALASLLENPRIARLLVSPTDAQLAEIPLDLRGDLWPVTQLAIKQGVKVSPKLLAVAAAAAGAANNAPKAPPVPPRPPVVNSQP